MKSKFLALLLMVLMVVTTSASAYAGFDVYDYEKDVDYAYRVAQVFLKNADKSVAIDNPILLENLKGNVEAVIFDMEEGGYIIVNINDLSIPEICFDGKNPYIGCENPAYNGPLSYLRREGNAYYYLSNNELFFETDSEIYEKQPLEDKDGYINSLLKDDKKRSRNRVVTKYLNHQPENWSYNTDDFCGALACAICLRYYHDYVDSNYVSSLFIWEKDLTTLMRGYVGWGSTNQEDLVTGLNKYFSDKEINNRAYHSGNRFDYNIIMNTVNRNRPAIVGIHNNTYDDHWLIVWGYHYKTSRNEKYVIVVDGHGTAEVWVSVSDNVLREIVYFNK